MSTGLDSDELLAFVTELADSADQIALRYFRQPLDIEQKPDLSPVTIADRAIEYELRERINKRFPQHGIYGEEYGQADTDKPCVWIIDPIDGTKSFISGMPTFGTLIALSVERQATLGVISAAALSERWIGVHGQVTRYNGQPCQTSHCADLAAATLFTTSIDMFVGDNLPCFERISHAVTMRRFGGDCYAYGLLASGFVDLVVEATMEPYDYMALVAVIEGAGGVISDWQGKRLGIHSDGRVVAAATAQLHEQTLRLLG